MPGKKQNGKWAWHRRSGSTRRRGLGACGAGSPGEVCMKRPSPVTRVDRMNKSPAACVRSWNSSDMYLNIKRYLEARERAGS